MTSGSFQSMFTEIHLLPVFVVAAIATAIVWERVFALYLTLPLPMSKKFMNRVRELVSQGRIEDAVALCEKNSAKPAAAVIAVGLRRAHQGEAAVRNGIELVIADNSSRIYARTPFLGTLANVSTLLGLCGTVLGLIQSFSSVEQLSVQQRTAAMASGISTAMNSTLLGLAVAILCMVAYSILMTKVSKISGEVERAALTTVDIITEQYLNLDQTNAGQDAA